MKQYNLKYLRIKKWIRRGEKYFFLKMEYISGKILLKIKMIKSKTKIPKNEAKGIGTSSNFIFIIFT